MLPIRLRRSLVALALLGSTFALHGAAQSLPTGFVTETIESGWTLPVDLCFIDGSRLLVAEKAGKVWYLEDYTRHNLVLDLQTETLNLLDRGLLAIAVDPQFATNGLLYLLLVVDPNGDGNDNEQESFARIVRYETALDGAGNLVVNSASRVDLIGDSWATGIPSCHFSHSVGTLAFLRDGSLVASVGDGAHYDAVDTGGLDPGCFGVDRTPLAQDIGSFRSVVLDSYSGKILRIDPATGLGLPDNPFFSGDPGDVPSRVWAMGLRNPFRFTLLPTPGPVETIAIGDVGWNSWEEINICRGGENFGWPCYEGAKISVHQSTDPQGFCTSMAAPASNPLLAWHHNNPGSVGFVGNCVSGLAYYQGTSYPPIYRNTLFFTDYGQAWMKVARLDSNLGIQTVLPFGTNMGAPIEITPDPTNGDLLFISLAGAVIRRLRYVGSNLPPIAVPHALPPWGAAPLNVLLSADGSYDPEGDPLSYAWDLGDGTISSQPSLMKVYAEATNYKPRLTVTDAQGRTSTTELLITPGNTPPRLTSVPAPLDGLLFKPDEPIDVSAFAEDDENKAANVPVDIVWTADLVHGHHTHFGQATVVGASGTLVLPGHGPGTSAVLHVRATDLRGLWVERTLALYDVTSAPAPHLVSISDASLRLGQTVSCTAHVDFAAANAGGVQPDLTWDWGDGTQDVQHALGHQQDVQLTHAYATLGNYTLTLTAQAGDLIDVLAQEIKVEVPHSAVAVFLPLASDGWIEWTEQQAISHAVVDSLTDAGTEAVSFAFDQQQLLVDWMTPYLDDGVRDVLVVLDSMPALLYSGQDDGSLAEQWLEHGNAIVWSGSEPFYAYIDDTGLVNTFGAGVDGADDVLDGVAHTGLCRGTGWQYRTPHGAKKTPSLSLYFADRALHYDKLGPEWSVADIFAEDLDQDSDAILLKHVSGGLYAQFMCTSALGTRRVDVLVEFLRRFAAHKTATPKRVPGSVPPH